VKLINYLSQSDIYPRLCQLFPSMVETAKDVDVIPWQDEFAVKDRNPEIIDAVEFYDILLSQKLITEAKYRELVDKIVIAPASRTEGIAFIKEKQVSFRTATVSIWTVIHELGHVHFQEPDPIWSSVYGGGEMLVHLALIKNFNITEKEVVYYHSLLHKAELSPASTAKEIAEQICNKIKIDCYPHLYALSLFSGILPDSLMEQLKNLNLEHLFDDYKNSDWERIEVTSGDIRHFLVNTVEGIRWGDSFSWAFAKALGLVLE